MSGKRLQAVYLEHTLAERNLLIGAICDLHYNRVGYWLQRYQSGGIEALLENNYGHNESELPLHRESILESVRGRCTTLELAICPLMGNFEEDKQAAIMVAKQVSPDKSCPSLPLKSLVPRDNFYRRLKQMLDLTYLYSAVEPYYGKCGQQSIDPVVFFKLLLVGHFENLTSDRAIIRTSQLRLDILSFLDYSVGQLLPWHSTLSRTRQRLPTSLFETCFQRILAVCVEAGMVSGDTQAIDSAFVEASASLDNLQAKALVEWSLEKNSIPLAEAPSNSPPISLKVTANPKKLTRNNRTHQSKTDTEARLAQKPGKPFRLYYLASMAVDTGNHVITHIQADLADEKDSRHLLTLVDRTTTGLKEQGLLVQGVLADGGFSSGSNYAALESRGIVAYISSNGVYQSEKGTFTYDEQRNEYVCSQGKVIRYHQTRMAAGYPLRYYYAKQSDCSLCPLKAACCGKRKFKYITSTAFRNPFERMLVRLGSYQGQRMKKLRSSTVEPVFGSLLNYFGMRRVTARGKTAAHKRMLLAATAYNLKKYLAFAGGPKAKVRALTLKSSTIFCPCFKGFLLLLDYP